ncbi:hypothetical protein BRC80_09195, partial [Halobacteriales archaeon QH_9_66_26]
ALFDLAGASLPLSDERASLSRTTVLGLWPAVLASSGFAEHRESFALQSSRRFAPATVGSFQSHPVAVSWPAVA